MGLPNMGLTWTWAYPTWAWPRHGSKLANPFFFFCYQIYRSRYNVIFCFLSILATPVLKTWKSQKLSLSGLVVGMSEYWKHLSRHQGTRNQYCANFWDWGLTERDWPLDKMKWHVPRPKGILQEGRPSDWPKCEYFSPHGHPTWSICSIRYDKV